VVLNSCLTLKFFLKRGGQNRRPDGLAGRGNWKVQKNAAAGFESLGSALKKDKAGDQKMKGDFGWERTIPRRKAQKKLREMKLNI